MHDEPSLRAVGLVWSMIQPLDLVAITELHRALHTRLHQPAPATDRIQEQLGPLAELLRQHGRPHRLQIKTRVQDRWVLQPGPSFQVISRDWYDQLCPDATSSKRLVERYDSWLKVCRAADGLLADGRYTGIGKPWPSSRFDDQGGHRQIHDESACLRAVQRCVMALGRVPSSTDYIRWRRLQIGANPRRDLRAVGLPTYDTIKARLKSWPLAVAGAQISDRQIRDARKAWQPLPADPGTPATAAERLAALDDEQLLRAELTDARRRRLVKNGCGELDLDHARTVATCLGGSLTWLAGLSDDPSPACLTNAVAPTGATDPDTGPGNACLDVAYIRERRTERGISEQAMCKRLKLTLAQWRGAQRQTHPIQLRQLITLAQILACDIDNFVA